MVLPCCPQSTNAAVAPSMPSARERQSQPSRASSNIISFLFAMAAWCMGVPAGQAFDELVLLQAAERSAHVARHCIVRAEPLSRSKKRDIRQLAGTRRDSSSVTLVRRELIFGMAGRDPPPTLSRQFTSVPKSTSCSTMAASPHPAARCSAVRPSASRASTCRMMV